VTAAGYAPGTLDSYSSALPKYLEFCDKCAIPHSYRFHASPQLISSFLLWCSGPMDGVPKARAPSRTISVDTASRYVSGIKAWHILHGYPWIWDHRPDKLKIWCKGIARLQGSLFQKAPRPPITLGMIACLVNNLNHNSHFNAAVLACAIVSFFTLFRLGESTVRSHKSYDPEFAITRGDIEHCVTDESVPYYSIHLRHDRTLPPGCTRLLCFTQAQFHHWWTLELLTNHLRTNFTEDKTVHLFMYVDRQTGSMHALTKEAFLNWVNKIWMDNGYASISGHSFRIGGTSLLLKLGFE
ncbi:hypothetical protein BT69DRAFT_1211165, partial [Atractiella rhizophila]